jgi:hypothetical protein
MFCFIGQIFDYDDAADHEYNILFPNDLKLVMYGRRAYSKGCIERQSKGG